MEQAPSARVKFINYTTAHKQGAKLLETFHAIYIFLYCQLLCMFDLLPSKAWSNCYIYYTYFR